MYNYIIDISCIYILHNWEYIGNNMIIQYIP